MSILNDTWVSWVQKDYLQNVAKDQNYKFSNITYICLLSATCLQWLLLKKNDVISLNTAAECI